jgi:hypothetical protein
VALWRSKHDEQVVERAEPLQVIAKRGDGLACGGEQPQDVRIKGDPAQSDDRKGEQESGPGEHQEAALVCPDDDTFERYGHEASKSIAA